MCVVFFTVDCIGIERDLCYRPKGLVPGFSLGAGSTILVLCSRDGYVNSKFTTGCLHVHVDPAVRHYIILQALYTLDVGRQLHGLYHWLPIREVRGKD